ncbi:MAG: TRAP transporter large permease subunit, partial [Burkholderiales bacterium]|nr:TRAP transporter large permease subunit [Burkholderiales bacterium]
DGGVWIEHMLVSMTGGDPVTFLIIVNIFVFFLAFFLDFFEIAFIIVPLLAPVAAKLGIDLIWFGVLLCVNMQTSFMHPPFGFALFYLRGIAPKEVKSSDIYLGAIPWVVLQLLLVAILIFWPGMVTSWLDKPVNVDTDKVQIEVQSFDEDPATKPAGGASSEAAKQNGSGDTAPAGGTPSAPPSVPAQGVTGASGGAVPETPAAKPTEEEDLGKRLMEQIRQEQEKQDKATK